jgi:broad specificity phosphatase PhoE
MEIYLARHGETQWSLDGRHTGRTDIPLVPSGEEQARKLGERLAGQQFDLVLTSPLQRARRTCDLAGFGTQARDEPLLMEWDYGQYEGLTTPQIRETDPDWTVFRKGAPDGESVEQITARCHKLLSLMQGERILLFAHAHILRCLAACWIGFTAAEGRCFWMQPAALSILGYEREVPVIRLWNVR